MAIAVFYQESKASWTAHRFISDALILSDMFDIYDLKSGGLHLFFWSRTRAIDARGVPEQLNILAL